jgi:hypothetical protein
MSSGPICRKDRDHGCKRLVICLDNRRRIDNLEDINAGAIVSL